MLKKNIVNNNDDDDNDKIKIKVPFLYGHEVVNSILTPHYMALSVHLYLPAALPSGKEHPVPTV
jgi:hypothetical protein